MAKQAALSDKQQAFCNEYIIDFNGTQAAIRAGYAEKGAAVTSSKLLINANVQIYIAELMQQRSSRIEVTQDRVLLEIARLAFNDPRKAFDSEGNLKPIQEWPDEVAAAISTIKITEVKTGDDEKETYLKEIKFWDKGKQIELAAKHLGMLNADKQQEQDKPEPKQIVFTVVDASA